MALTLGLNIASFQAQSALSSATNKLSKSYQKLSSGSRIPTAADDPGGLGVAERCKADALIADAGMRNANDGLALLSIADGALDEVGSILSRMSELAEQYGNGTYTSTQKDAIKSEYDSLEEEITRISGDSKYNGSSVFQATNIQVGSSTVSVSTAFPTLSLTTISTSAVETAMNSITTTRGTIGGHMSRLSYASDVLGVMRDAYFASESQVRDVDVALEAANMAKLSVLQQSASAIVAQANQQPEVALSLLLSN